MKIINEEMERNHQATVSSLASIDATIENLEQTLLAEARALGTSINTIRASVFALPRRFLLISCPNWSTIGCPQCSPYGHQWAAPQHSKKVLSSLRNWDPTRNRELPIFSTRIFLLFEKRSFLSIELLLLQLRKFQQFLEKLPQSTQLFLILR